VTDLLLEDFDKQAVRPPTMIQYKIAIITNITQQKGKPMAINNTSAKVLLLCMKQRPAAIKRNAEMVTKASKYDLTPQRKQRDATMTREEADEVAVIDQKDQATFNRLMGVYQEAASETVEKGG
jgi:hypothetical protein